MRRLAERAGDPSVDEHPRPLAARPSVFAAVVAAGLILDAFRVWPRLHEPTLWAEDGKIFLAQAHEDGGSAFWTPYMGYLHLLPRIVAAVFEPLPLTWQPELYAATASVLGFAVALFALSPRLEWLLPAAWQRQLLFLLLLVAPSRSEVSANIANLIFFGGLALLLIALADPPRTAAGRTVEAVGVVVLGLSGPIIALLLPVFIARVVRTRSRYNGLILTLAAATGLAQWLILALTPRVGDTDGSLTVWGRFLGGRLVSTWLLGNTEGSGFAAGHAAAAGVVSAAVLAVVAVALLTIRSRWTAAALIVTVLATTLAPSLAYGFFANTVRAPRHLLVPDAVFVMVLIAALGAGAWRATLAAAALCVGLVGVANDYVLTVLPYKPLGPAANCLREQPVCTVTVNPNGFDFQLHR